MAHTLPDLPYAYDALEPYISRQIMELHHKKHHQTYVNGLNAAEEAYAKTDSPKDRIKLQSALKFNGGGHINHSLFWKNLAPQSQGGGELPAGALKEKIEAEKGFDAKALKLIYSGTHSHIYRFKPTSHAH